MAPPPPPPHAKDKSNVHSPNAKPLLKPLSPKGRPFNKTKPSPPTEKAGKAPQQPSSLSARSGKPIINWLQRKLAGSRRGKRPPPDATTALSKGRNSPRGNPRVVSSPVPSPSYAAGVQQLDVAPPVPRKTVSLNDDDVPDSSVIGDSDNNSLGHSSLAPGSTWSPSSILEADEDASVRPLPPSAPSSPSPSPSTASYVSDPRTFRSIAASTKPTTVLSLEMGGTGMAHIAQAPTTPPAQYRFPQHIRASSSINHPNGFGNGTSVTFSPLPQSSSHPSSIGFGNPIPSHLTQQGISSIQAPLHTAHHPRNNPRPSSPPLDNASILTLASSAYAIPGFRAQLGHSTAASARGLGDSLSQLGGGGSVAYADAESTSQFLLGDEDRLDERDVDASVRALRPRSSRRGSWESEASRWSARDPAGGTSLMRNRSLGTTYSLKTGPPGVEDSEVYNQSEEAEKLEEKDLTQSSPSESAYTDAMFEVPPTPVETPKPDGEDRTSPEPKGQRVSTDA